MAGADLTLGFDADDTLWHNETIFEGMHERYRALLSRFHDPVGIDAALLATERRNVGLYGYGIKGFTLSAIETAIDLSGGQLGAEEVRTILGLGREMLAHPVSLLEGVAATLEQLSRTHRLLLITKGDLKDQERKVEKSGLGARFKAVEVVSEKDRTTYAAILRRHGIDADRFVMIGNSVKSDIVPVLELGGFGVHVPYHVTWELEKAEVPAALSQRFFAIPALSALPGLLPRLEA